MQGDTPGRFELTKLAKMPCLGDSPEAASVAYQCTYYRHPAFASEYSGVKVLALFTHGPGMIFNTQRPITRIEGLAGLKFRVGGGTINDIGKALGMNLTLKPSVESYELLRSGGRRPRPATTEVFVQAHSERRRHARYAGW